MTPRPLLLGLLWLVSLFCEGQTQDDNHETHQVYSYTYHFQHNGTTDPQKFVQSVLAKPPNGRGAEVKTFWNPNVRGFVSQGFFPGGPPKVGFDAHSKPPTFEGIKKIVEENLKQVPNPTPPEHIKIPPNVENTIRKIDEKVNRRLSNFNNRLDNLDLGPPAIQGPPGGISRNPPSTHVNNGVVTNVKTFEKNLPNGKVFEKIETISYNPAPVHNAIEGPQHQGFNHHNQRAFGRTVSYFRKEHRTNVAPLNNIAGDFPINNVRNIENNLLHENNHEFQVNNHFNNDNHERPLDNIVRNLNEIRNNVQNGFGARLNNIPNHNNNRFENHHHNNNPSHDNRNAIHQNRHNNNNNNNNRNFHNSENVNTHHNRNFHNPEHQNQNQNRNFHHNQANQNVNNNNHLFHNPAQHNANQNNNRHVHNVVQNVRQHLPNPHNFGAGRVDNPANQVFNTLNQLSRNTLNNAVGHSNTEQRPRPNLNPFTWDDDNRGWRVDANMDWSRRNPFAPENNQVFSNNVNNNHNQQHNRHHHNNPVDALRSTLQALTGGAFEIQNLNGIGGQEGNYNNFRGGGEERTYRVERITEGPNSFQRNQHRRYDRNFVVGRNSGYQFSKRWSTGDLNKVGTSRNARSPTFKKDFIDVFADDV